MTANPWRTGQHWRSVVDMPSPANVAGPMVTPAAARLAIEGPAPGWHLVDRHLWEELVDDAPETSAFPEGKDWLVLTKIQAVIVAVLLVVAVVAVIVLIAAPFYLSTPTHS